MRAPRSVARKSDAPVTASGEFPRPAAREKRPATAVPGRCHGYDWAMAVAVKKLDVRVGDVVQIADRRYDVVSDKSGGVALEPAISKTVDELHAERGARALTGEEFDKHFGDLPSDEE